jgi:hypothetical protein
LVCEAGKGAYDPAVGSFAETGRRAMQCRVPTTLLLALASSLAIACDRSPTTPTTCSYDISSSALAFGAGGGQGSVTVATTTGCGWTVTSDVPWLTLGGGSSGSGSGSVAFSVSANPDAAERRATVRVSDQSLVVKQEGRPAEPCAYTVSPESQAFPAGGGVGALAVSAAAGCAWTASCEASWISITSGSQGAGNGSVAFTVAENRGSLERNTVLNVAGRAVAVRQDPPGPPVMCDYSVSPTEVTLPWGGAPGGVLDISLTTGPSCVWTVSSTVGWLHVNTPAGTGPATISVRTEIYTDENARAGVVQVRWPTPTAGQNVRVEQTGCHFVVVPSVADISAAGGRTRVDVLNQEDFCPMGCGCPGSASSPVGWIRIVTTLPQNGDGTLSFDVEANTGAARSATLLVAGKPLVVSQQGR